MHEWAGNNIVTLLDRCRDGGIVYADSHRNGVFLCQDRQRSPACAEPSSTRPAPDGRVFEGMTHGARRTQSGFRLPANTSDPNAILLVKSAVDALSLYCSSPPCRPKERTHREGNMAKIPRR